MAEITLRRSKADRLFERTSAHCDSCSGCGVQGSKQIDLPGVKTDVVELTLGSGAVTALLLNAWLKPVGLMVVATIICMTLELNEAWTIALSILSFMGGLVLCKSIDNQVLTVRPLEHEPIQPLIVKKSFT